MLERRVTGAIRMKPPILLLHGACSQPSHMAAWHAYFSSLGYQCSVPALPGHGDGQPVAHMTMRDYRKAVGEAHAAFDNPPVVIGHSLGGLLAQQLAAKESCAALVLLGSLPAGRLPVTPYALPYFLSATPMVLLGRPIAPARAALRALTVQDLSVAEREEVLPEFVPESGRVYRRLAFALERVDAGRIKCPILVVQGDADRLVPVAVGRKLAERFGADLAIIPGRGHWLIAGSLVETVAVPIAEWIEGLAESQVPRS